ncbi:MAG: hypothetical protein ACJA08_000446 [Cyclobacteriaceae bacterium]|jgi:hypothetical protein
MKKSILLSLILTAGFTLPFSCDPTNTGNGNSGYRIDSLSLEVVRMDKILAYPYYQYGLLGSVEYPVTDTILFYKFGLEIAVAAQTYVMNNNGFSSPFINSAFADPLPPSPVSNIALISIYSDSAVFVDGIEYEIGENLANLFTARVGGGTVNLNPF